MNLAVERAGQRPTLRIHPTVRLPGSSLRLVTVAAADRPMILPHFLRLSEADRRLRFMLVMSDDAVESHVAAIDLTLSPRLALLHRARSLVVLAEGFIFVSGTRPAMEVAFSTDAAWRRQGLARFLWSAMAARARDRGVARMVLHCDTRNAGMRGQLSAVGAQTRVEATEIHAIWPVVASC